MNKLTVALFAILIAVNFTLWFTAASAINLFAVGFAIGVLYMDAVDWWLDRKLNREIMEEIDALTRNYDCQMSLFETKENK